MILGDGGYFASLHSATANNAIASAYSLESSGSTWWSTDEDPLVANYLIPHMTTSVETTAGRSEFFSVDIGAGETIDADIDFGSNSAIGTNVDTYLVLLDGSGNVVSTGDNSLAGDGSLGSNDNYISNTKYDAYPSYTAPAAGTYYIEVRRYVAGTGDTDFAGGETFALNVSVTGHAVNATPTPMDADTINGGDGDDTIIWRIGDGRDVIDGGLGKDKLDLSGASVGISIDLLEGVADIGSEKLNLISVENLIATNYADIITTYGTGALIYAGDGADKIYVGDGSGVLHGEAGDDQIFGGDIGGLLYGDDGNDKLYGGIGEDNLYGNAGNDRLYGRAGQDVLDGSVGSDVMSGGDGDDLYYVDAQNDRIIEAITGGNDTVNSNAPSFKLNRHVEILILTGTVSIGGSGNAMDNSIFGNDNNNRLNGLGGEDIIYGGDGNDIIDGGRGADTMMGGSGNDTYYVDDPGDIVQDNDGIVTIIASIDYAGSFTRLILTGSARIGTGSPNNNIIIGSDGNDTISGLGGSDNLQGGLGNDKIDGGTHSDLIYGDAGRDRLTGGTEGDSFVFRAGDTGSTNSTADRITDFTHGGDKIVLSLIDPDVSTGGDDAFAFIGTAAFSGVAGQLRYQLIGSDTYVQGDTDGNGTADIVIRLTGATILMATDFAL